MDIYIPDNTTSILHYVTVDFTKRFVETPVHLVQYDASLPILAITLMQSGNAFDLPEGSVALLKYGKNDRTFVILDPLGVSSDGSTVFFEVPYQMTVESGTHNPIVEVWIDGKVGASSSFVIIVDRNPVQNAQIESNTDYKALIRFKNEAAASAEAAATSETNAANSATAAANSESASALSEQAAANSAAAALVSEQNAADSATRAALSETNAAASELAAKTSETNAKASEERSEQILDTMEQMVEGGLTYLVVDELPAEGQNYRTIYLVPSVSSTIPGNNRDEWLWTESGWELIGTVRGDLIIDTNVTIAPEDWNTETRTAVKSVNGVSNANKVYVFPVGDVDRVYCESQAVNQLTFAMTNIYAKLPTEAVHFSIQIINPVLST